MVISAFESVPGLANATPYISRSLRTISRHFRCLKNAIADQLKYIKNALGEDLSPPAAFSRSDCTSLRLSQNFAKVKSGSFGGMGYQNHIWRPQRGLPERAVSILRAWLFDHFLHPYVFSHLQSPPPKKSVSSNFIAVTVKCVLTPKTIKMLECVVTLYSYASAGILLIQINKCLLAKPVYLAIKYGKNHLYCFIHRTNILT